METRAALKNRYPGAETFRFGDNEMLCADLIARVRSGRKRATCSVRDHDIDGEVPAQIGRCDIALNWDGTPALVIRTLELREVRFCDMTEEMALLEGEDDTLDGWRAQHRAYFERNNVFSPQMMLIWERFELVEDLADD